MHSFLEDATLKELRRHSRTPKQSQLLQSCEKSFAGLLNPGFQSQPWAGISQRFQRYSSHLEVSFNLGRWVGLSFEPANSERILKILIRPSAEAID